jgi:hypothetical protein
MEQNQAISFVNEIRDACETVSQADLQLIEVKTNAQFAIGYTVLIKFFLNSVCKRQVVNIAHKYSLAMKEKKNGLMIFQPRNPKNSSKRTDS